MEKDYDCRQAYPRRFTSESGHGPLKRTMVLDRVGRLTSELWTQRVETNDGYGQRWSQWLTPNRVHCEWKRTTVADRGMLGGSLQIGNTGVEKNGGCGKVPLAGLFPIPVHGA